MLFNTSAAGHSKRIHDQIGGTIHSHLDRCSKSNGPNQFRLKPNMEVAIQVAHHLRNTFNVSKNGILEREFYAMRVEHIFLGESPFDRFLDNNGDGIKKFHSCMIEEHRVRFRKVSCACDQCVKSCYKRQCNQQLYAGSWTNWIDIPFHVSYDELVKTNRKRPREHDGQDGNSRRKKQKTT